MAENKSAKTPADDGQPVAWMYVNYDGECEQIEYGETMDDPSVTPLYTAPPKKQWVGLTDEEREYFRGLGFVGVSVVEAKLKERNG